MAKIIYLNKEQLSTGIKGKDLGLAPSQKDNLEANFRNAIASYQTSVNTVQMIEPAPPVEEMVPPKENAQENLEVTVSPTPIAQAVEEIRPEPIVEPIVNSELNPIAENTVLEPFAPDAPTMDTMLNQVLDAPSVSHPSIEPTTPPVIENIPVMDPEPISEPTKEPEPSITGPQIISASEKNIFEQMTNEINQLVEEYHTKINTVIEGYRKQIEDALNEANAYKEKAAEHLKNAQAAEQIAHMAYENSQKVNLEETNFQELDKIA